jgi:hypothetical protein
MRDKGKKFGVGKKSEGERPRKDTRGKDTRGERKERRGMPKSIEQ